MESKDPPKVEQAVEQPKKRNGLILWLTLILVAIAAVCFGLWFFYYRYYESTTDAYVGGDLVNVTAVINGTPVAYFADNTDLVEEGQLLVQFDTTDYQIQYDQALANLANTARQVKQMYEEVIQQELQVGIKQANLRRAAYDFENRKRLAEIYAVSQEDYIHAQDSLAIAELELKQAEEQLCMAQTAAGDTAMQQHPLLVAQKAVVREAYYRLKHCAIVAPVKGYVVQRTVEVGQWMAQGRPLMAIVPMQRMWIDANFKETQLRKMRVGQPVAVTIDQYGSDVVFQGKVIGIESGTGSVFSLIPPQNATGNWIKIVQRLAVRVGLDLENMQQYPLRLGLSCEATVHVAETNLPMLVQAPRQQVLAKTSVYALDFAALEEQMAEIIAQNLGHHAG